MKLKLDYNNMMADFVGAQGISQADIDGLGNRIVAAHKALADKRGQMAWRDLPHNQDDIVEEILEYVAEVLPRIDTLVVLGIGGSALGPIALQAALHSPLYNFGNRPRLFVLDNIDPTTIKSVFAMLSLETTLFSVVSKSGATSETMAQFMIVKEMLETRLGKERAAKHIVCTTDTENGNLIKIAKVEGYKTFYVPNGVGGRFSQLCPVGLLPAAFCGLDIRALLAGAAEMDRAIEGNPHNMAYMFAILHYLTLKNGKNITVMMPYSDNLKYTADWFAQLWGESLGKRYDNNGNEVFVGQTPVRALGATDQHSQVQLYMQGPFDKVVVFLAVDEFACDIDIPKTFEDMPSIGFLGGNTLATLLNTQQKTTAYALQKAGRPNMSITLAKIDEHIMGQLFYMLEVATAFAGELLNIDAFDQPGVEEGKDATYALFNRPGYEAKKAELEAAPPKNPKYFL
ncbi:MAG: glucose-6-phosphate isomerase [Defluviitaleaceae bacterium]|nr:glucose-6-phosphate isomerase [Defluviitaleaceae bacterium]